MDAVAVFYGYCQEPGSLGSNSGNPYKDDYRRLSRVEDVKLAGSHAKTFQEINSLLTEDNLRRLFTDRPLELRAMS